MKQKHFIDSHKGITGLFVLALISAYGRWDSPTAWVYLGLHGCYGVLWALKSRLFGDKAWEEPATPAMGVQAYVFLSLYWVAPWLITRQDVQAPAWVLAMAILAFGLGAFLHFTADMQKWVALQLRPGLITTGVWARTRNPNYLGELLIYGSFALLSLHWAPWVILAFFFLTTWLPRMRKKDESLSRYPEFAAYKARSGLLLPSLAPGQTEAPPVTAGS